MQLRCFLVDDNDGFLAAATALLEREGMTVVGVARAATEALQQVQALRPDVILIDIGLGGESGFDLARAIAPSGQAEGVPVIMISTRAEADYAKLISDSPAAGFLPKSKLSAHSIGRILGQSP